MAAGWRQSWGRGVWPRLSWPWSAVAQVALAGERPRLSWRPRRLPCQLWRPELDLPPTAAVVVVAAASLGGVASPGAAPAPARRGAAASLAAAPLAQKIPSAAVPSWSRPSAGEVAAAPAGPPAASELAPAKGEAAAVKKKAPAASAPVLTIELIELQKPWMAQSQVVAPNSESLNENSESLNVLVLVLDITHM